MSIEQILAQADKAAMRGLGRNLTHFVAQARAMTHDPGILARIDAIEAHGSQRAYDRSKEEAERYLRIGAVNEALDHLFEAQRSVPHTSHADEHDLWVSINQGIYLQDIDEAAYLAREHPTIERLERAQELLGQVRALSERDEVPLPPAYHDTHDTVSFTLYALSERRPIGEEAIEHDRTRDYPIPQSPKTSPLPSYRDREGAT